ARLRNRRGRSKDRRARRCWQRTWFTFSKTMSTNTASTTVIASEAKQSILPRRKCGLLRRFAPRNDGQTSLRPQNHAVARRTGDRDEGGLGLLQRIDRGLSDRERF